MAFKDFLGQQRDGMQAMATSGVIGLHMASGPIVGVAIGYGIDAWFATAPYFTIGFLFVGIGAGFLNVWRDTKDLIRRLEKESRYKQPENK